VAAFCCFLATIFLACASAGLVLAGASQVKQFAWADNKQFSNGLWVTPAGYTTGVYQPVDVDKLSPDFLRQAEPGSLGDPVYLNGVLQYGFEAGGYRPAPAFSPIGFRRRLDEGKGGAIAGEAVAMAHGYSHGMLRRAASEAGEAGLGDRSYGEAGDMGGGRELWVPGSGVRTRPTRADKAVAWYECAAGFPTSVGHESRVRSSYVAYMKAAGFLERQLHDTVKGDWPQVCRSCARSRWAIVLFAAVAFASALVELAAAFLRGKARTDSSEAKLASVAAGSALGAVATSLMVFVFVAGCMDPLLRVKLAGAGSSVSSGSVLATLAAVLRCVAFFLHLGLRAGSPTPLPELGCHHHHGGGVSAHGSGHGYERVDDEVEWDEVDEWETVEGDDEEEDEEEDDEEERRIDHDGHPHTLPAFMEYYGDADGAVEWNNAEPYDPPPKARKEKRRRLVKRLIMREKPAGHGDGDKHWHDKGRGEEELRYDYDGSLHTRQGFLEFYGNVGGMREWARAELYHGRPQGGGSSHHSSQHGHPSGYPYDRHEHPHEQHHRRAGSPRAGSPRGGSPRGSSPREHRAASPRVPRDASPRHVQQRPLSPRGSVRSVASERGSVRSSNRSRSPEYHDPRPAYRSPNASGPQAASPRRRDGRRGNEATTEAEVAAWRAARAAAEAEAAAQEAAEERGEAAVAASPGLGPDALVLDTRRVKSPDKTWRPEVRDPETGKWVADTKEFRRELQASAAAKRRMQRQLDGEYDDEDDDKEEEEEEGEEEGDEEEDRVKAEVPPAASAPDPEPEVYRCSNGCGFEGDFSATKAHEAACAFVKAPPAPAPAAAAPPAPRLSGAAGQFAGLEGEDLLALRRAWAKVLDFLARDGDAPLKFVKVFKEAAAAQGGGGKPGEVPIDRLMAALESMGVDLAAAEARIWLERQDMDRTGTISLAELSKAIAGAAAMKQELVLIGE